MKKEITKKPRTRKAVKKKSEWKKSSDNLPAVVKPEMKLPEISDDLIIKYMSSFGLANSLTDSEKSQFIEIARAFQLNPFKREVYCIPYMTSAKDDAGKWSKVRKLSIITGYEVYLKRGERTGKLNGWSCDTTGTGMEMSATITIYRKDWQYPFKHTVQFREVAQLDDTGKPRAMWAKMGSFMLKKVCLAQGFRLCFPDEIGGMPCIADELPANMTSPEYIEPEKQQREKIPQYLSPTENPDNPSPADIPDAPEVPIDYFKTAENLIETSQKTIALTNRGREISSCVEMITDEDKKSELRAMYKRRMEELIKMEKESAKK